MSPAHLRCKHDRERGTLEDMEGFVIEVRAYHGDPVVVNGLPTRSCCSIERPVPPEHVSYVPDELEPKEFPLLQVIEAFEAKHKCKVNFGDPTLKEGLPTFEFDVFEPSWRNEHQAKAVVDELTWQLCDWVRGDFV